MEMNEFETNSTHSFLRFVDFLQNLVMTIKSGKKEYYKKAR